MCSLHFESMNSQYLALKFVWKRIRDIDIYVYLNFIWLLSFIFEFSQKCMDFKKCAFK